MLIKSLLFNFQTLQCYLRVPECRRSRCFHSSIIPLLYFFNCDAAHFDAHLGPGPDIPGGLSDHVLVQGFIKVTHDLTELTQVAGLDSQDLLVTDAPEEVVTTGLVRATRWPCDLRVARDHLCPERRCQNNGQLLPDPLDREIGIYSVLCKILSNAQGVQGDE